MQTEIIDHNNETWPSLAGEACFALLIAKWDCAYSFTSARILRNVEEAIYAGKAHQKNFA